MTHAEASVITKCIRQWEKDCGRNRTLDCTLLYRDSGVKKAEKGEVFRHQGGGDQPKKGGTFKWRKRSAALQR